MDRSREWSAFETQVPGKWVLAGEHSVLRGGSAIALPHPEFSLRLRFTPSSSLGGTNGALKVFPSSSESAVRDLLQRIRDQRESDDQSFTAPGGELHIESTIPIGAGLGSSAALCVAVTRWVSGPLGIKDVDVFEFARGLEHFFHGRSSGMDVAVVSQAEPISFTMERGIKRLGIRKLPRFTFHDTGLRARTSDCIVRVEQFREENPVLSMKLDETMAMASRTAMEGLIQYDQGRTSEGLRLVAEAMKGAQECFYSWQLVPGAAKRMEEQLLRDGALAAKLTGAGGGGFVVALWPENPLYTHT